jgi:hypothetical protein
MDRKKTQDLLDSVTKHGEVMRAFVEGKEIQVSWYYAAGKWATTTDPVWSVHNEYRVKPSPQTLFSVVNKENKIVGVYDTRNQAEIAGGYYNKYGLRGPYTIKEFVEVPK